MDLKKGEIRRKVRLSWVEESIPGLKKEPPKEISFVTNQIQTISYYNADMVIVQLKNPPFASTDDFHLLVKTYELFKSTTVMNNIIDKILKEIEEKGHIPVHKDSSVELTKAIPKMKALKLVQYDNHSLRLTSSGYEVLEIGGIEQWLKKRTNEQDEKTTPNQIINNTINGNVSNTNFGIGEIVNQEQTINQSQLSGVIKDLSLLGVEEEDLDNLKDIVTNKDKESVSKNLLTWTGKIANKAVDKGVELQIPLIIEKISSLF